MTQNGAKRQCRNCDFCRQIGEAMLCVRNAPAPDPTTGDALWPHVRPTDYCGQFCGGADQNRPSSLVAREAQIPADVSRDSCPVTRDSQIPADASRGSSPVARRSQAEIHNQSGRNAASDPNSKSSIVNSKSQIGLPICEDEFGPYCQIPLTQNRFAKVDPADYIWLSQFRWCCKTGKDTCYAIRHIQDHGRTKRIHMHRQIMNTPNNMICDHKNHDGLDNRRLNLRNCTTEQNNANRRKRGTGHGPPVTSSQYLGVSWCPRRKKWVSYIKHKGKARNLGLYALEADAARAHDRAAWAQWGEYACLNFPDEYPGHPAARQAGGDPCPVTRGPKEEEAGGGRR